MCVCKVGFAVYKFACLEKCPEKTYLEGSKCFDCPEGSDKCTPTTVDHKLTQTKENCDIEDICFLLKFSNSKDKSKDVGKLSFPSGEFKFFKIEDTKK